MKSNYNELQLLYCNSCNPLITVILAINWLLQFLQSTDYCNACNLELDGYPIPNPKRLIWISNLNTFQFPFAPFLYLLLAASFRAMRVKSLNVASQSTQFQISRLLWLLTQKECCNDILKNPKTNQIFNYFAERILMEAYFKLVSICMQYKDK